MKLEILVPSWPETGDNKFGQGRDYGPTSGCDSTWMSFRARPEDGSYDGAYECRVWQDIALYVWLDRSGTVQLELKARDIFSADLRQLELLTKTLRSAIRKVGDLPSTTVESLPFVLGSICTRLGIKRTVQYHGINVEETFAPVSTALAYVCDEVRRKHGRLQLSAA